MTLLGEKSWYIPRWLDKLLPNITIEPPHDGGREAVPERPAPAPGQP
jgi:RND superfamily putative drug exporter